MITRHRKRAVVLVISSVIGSALAMGVVGIGGGNDRAGAASRTGGIFHTSCQFSHALPDDPIVFPNQAGASHLHNFFGNKTTNAASTLASLNNGGTTCRVKNGVDRSGYWMPGLYFNGNYVPMADAQAYYESTVGIVKTPPIGSEVIGGNAKATEPPSKDVVKWTCDNNSGIPGQTSPPKCPAGTRLKVVVKTPNCLKSDHLAGVHNDTPFTTYAFMHGDKCPSGYDPLPSVRIEAKYPEGVDGRGTITLASGPYYTMHADFFNAWDPATLDAFVQGCINQNKDCGSTAPSHSTPPTTTGSPPTNMTTTTNAPPTPMAITQVPCSVTLGGTIKKGTCSGTFTP